MDVKEFLNKSYTAYHAVKNGAEMLEKAGFKKLDMKDVWRLEKTSAITSSKTGRACLRSRRAKITFSTWWKATPIPRRSKSREINLSTARKVNDLTSKSTADFCCIVFWTHR